MYALHLYLRLIGIQLRSQWQYRVSAIFETVTSAISTGFYFATLALVMQRFQQVGGWRISEIALLWGMVELSFGLMDMIFAGFDPDAFSPLVRQGSFNGFLLRPASITLQVLGSRFVTRRLGRVFEGAAILIIGIVGTQTTLTPAKLAFMPVIALGMVAFFGGLFIVGATLTFWTIQPIEAVNIFTYGGSEMLSYPMNIYPNWLRSFFTYIIPAALLNFYPALWLLDRPVPAGLPVFSPALAPLVGFGTLAAALLFWQVGVRAYQGTGT